MDHTEGLANTMNNISLEDEEESGIEIDVGLLAESNTQNLGFNARLSMVGRFITEGRVDLKP